VPGLRRDSPTVRGALGVRHTLKKRPTTEIPFTGRPSRFAHDDNDIIVRDDRQIRVIDATQALHELDGRLAALLTTDAVDEHHAEWTFGVSHGART
jgi:hypothetical protein